MTQKNKTMLTDLYQLTMNAAYYDNKKDDVATFDMFIRKLPTDWGYFLANGVEDAIDIATNLKFKEEDIEYLRLQKIFKENYLEFLKDFKFEGEIYAVKEGTTVFPNQPILRVTAPRTQAQLIESAILNTINFQTMIASKANRVVNAAAPGTVVDFGLRRGQEEDAAVKGSRATYIAGAVATSNVKAGQIYGIPISGTHAHSFVMSFEEEIEAFRKYVKTFPNNATLLIDTYDTLEGAKKAAIVGKELEAEGNKLGAVRLDSGDLTKLSKGVREILDEAGLNYVRITASNDLNEYKIAQMKENGSKVTGFGVGTEMITAKPVAAISGVYKIVEDEMGGKIKLSSSKKSYPGKKQIYRVSDEQGTFLYDIMALEGESVEGKGILEKVVENGMRIRKRATLGETKQYVSKQVSSLPSELRELRVTSQYEMKISNGLQTMIDKLTTKYSVKKEQEIIVEVC